VGASIVFKQGIHDNFYSHLRDANETKSWMNEKETALLSDDCGRDLASVQALQRKHEGLERELAALEDKVGDLGEEARRLQGRHPDSADRIAAKQAEIVGLWEAIKRKVRLEFRRCRSLLRNPPTGF
jgi:spectrin alpha